jgi:hypothetical protein
VGCFVVDLFIAVDWINSDNRQAKAGEPRLAAGENVEE